MIKHSTPVVFTLPDDRDVAFYARITDPDNRLEESLNMQEELGAIPFEIYRLQELLSIGLFKEAGDYVESAGLGKIVGLTAADLDTIEQSGRPPANWLLCKRGSDGAFTIDPNVVEIPIVIKS